MRRLIYIIILISLVAPSSKAATVFFAQSSAGGNTGADCADAIALSSVTWVAANTYHVCGTITSQVSPGVTGTAGNLITIIFETGANITRAGGCGTTGCINLSGLNYFLIDGSPSATACGVVALADVACNGTIAATGVGTGSGQGDSLGINCMGGCSHVEVRNLNCNNMYIHTGLPGNDNPSGTYYCFHSNGTNNFVHNNVMHDAYGCLVGEAGTQNSEYSFNVCYRSNWGAFLSGPSTNTPDSITLNKIHDNHFYDFKNWDTTGNVSEHHDGIIIAGNNNLANGISHTDVYNNRIGGSLSDCSNSCMTANIFVNDANTTRGFNNILTHDGGTAAQTLGLLYTWSPGTLQSGDIWVNNTIVGANIANEASCTIRGDASITFENNICMTAPGELIVSYTSPATTYTALDYNMYQAPSLTGEWQIVSVATYSTLANWTTNIKLNGAPAGSEAHSLSQTASLNLNGSYRQNTGSAVIGAGVCLGGLSITALNSDIAGNARPACATAWDMGAWFGAAANGSNTITPTAIQP